MLYKPEDIGKPVGFFECKQVWICREECSFREGAEGHNSPAGESQIMKNISHLADIGKAVGIDNKNIPGLAA